MSTPYYLACNTNELRMSLFRTGPGELLEQMCIGVKEPAYGEEFMLAVTTRRRKVYEKGS